MENLLTRLEAIPNCKEILRQSCKRNGLNTSLGGELTVPKLKLLNEKFKKVNACVEAKTRPNWIENQLKAYNWLLIAISALENAKIADFGQKQWILLQNIFQFKTRNFLKFEARRFLQERKSKNKNWTEQQNRLLLKIVHQMQKNDEEKNKKEENGQNCQMEDCESKNQLRSAQNGNKDQRKEKIHWNEVARALFEQSGELYFRSAKHCRQRWYNYIDPSIERGKWKEAEDETLCELVKKKGKKWAQIAAILHRTQHTVKNRFNSLQMKGKKEVKVKISSDQQRQPKLNTQQSKISFFSMKDDSEKPPMITISEFPERKNSKNDKVELEAAQFIEDADDHNDPTKSTKSQYLFSPFQSFSPRNLTPFIGSPSPINFSLFKRNFGSQTQYFKDFLINGQQSGFSNEKL